MEEGIMRFVDHRIALLERRFKAQFETERKSRASRYQEGESRRVYLFFILYSHPKASFRPPSVVRLSGGAMAIIIKYVECLFLIMGSLIDSKTPS